MTNAVAQATQNAGAVLEQVITKGNLALLSEQDRVMYYKNVCESLGLNPLTKPFEYITLNGKLVLYALRGATEQLRKINNISLEIVDQKFENDLLIIHVRAKGGDGRQDEDFGAVPLPESLKGEARVNAILKAVTKAKRRVTLSICGLGMLDETEVESIPAAAKVAGEVLAEVQEVAKAEYRPSDPLRPYKDEYVIPAPVTASGDLDFDEFATILEVKIQGAKNLQEISLWNRANAKTLRVMEKERPDLFKAIGDEFNKMANALK